ncbi:MAG: translocation and assembly module TamB, partial [Planctomycetota bacterium]
RVVFDARDPFVPKIELTGRMRLKGYDLRANVSGDYDDPLVRLSSSPPLPNQDLLVLFLTGQLPEGSGSQRGRGAAQSVAVYFAQDYLTRWISGTEESNEESLLARIDVSIGDDITRDGALTTSVTYLMTKRVKHTGSERYLIGEKDAFDRINFGYGLRFLFE